MGRGLSHRLLEADIPSFRRAAAMRGHPIALGNSSAEAAPENDYAGLDIVGLDIDVAAVGPDMAIRRVGLSEGMVVDGQGVGAGDIAQAQLLTRNWMLLGL